MGELGILDHSIPCAVLDDGRRVLSGLGLRRACGATGNKSLKKSNDSGFHEVPPFLAANNLKPFISKGFAVSAISYQPIGGGPVINGYGASILPQACQIYLAARRAGKLHKSQEHIAEVGEIVIGALAEVIDRMRTAAMQCEDKSKNLSN